MSKKSKRYRIQPDIASKIGLKLNKSNRYRLSGDELNKYLEFKKNNSFEDILHSNNFTPEDNWEYGWVKTKNGSIFVRNPNNSNEFTLDEFREDLKKELREYSPKFKKFTRYSSKTPHALVIDISDLHVGKYSSPYETGEQYDMTTAYKRAIEGLKGILDKTSGFDIDQIVFVIGNDILHTDTTKKTTTSGVPQDTDGAWYENFLMAKDIYVQCIEVLLPIANIHIVHCPSNHDYMSGFMLADTIHSYFRLSENVTFDIDMSDRKYYEYGENLIGLSHGDGTKMADTPLLMANEYPQGWARTKYRYVYLHHIHHKEQWKFKGGKDYQGVTVEYLRSPSSSDGWHHRNGYQHAKRAIEAFVHCKNHGQVSRVTHHF